ncbi:MAG TPA: D-2-hydroxyacid dehydrogenase [Gemmatimonadaceae bacterium]|nr:D-2-hydroxyacid dehydrogenase [Gemmatimonadaceae bacterium]
MTSPSRRLVLDLNARSASWALTPAAERAIRDAAPAGWEVVAVRALTSSDGDGALAPSDEALAAIGPAEVYVGFGITPPLFRTAPALRWVHSAAAGVRGALFPEMLASPVLLTNSAGVHGVPIAEYVLAGVLHLMRGLDLAGEQQRERRWDKSRFVGEGSPLRELGDARVLIVGVGGLGGEVATRMAAFGARCVGLRRRPTLGTPPGFVRVASLDAVDDELASADVVVLAAPWTPETDGLLSARRLALLKTSAIVVNVARGSLVDESALASALAAGGLRGAVLDVFREEPLPADSPLWAMRQVVLTPHVSPVTPGRFWDRQLDLILDNWRRYLEGAPLRNLVDKHAGY